jgi:hypothetical protein
MAIMMRMFNRVSTTEELGGGYRGGAYIVYLSGFFCWSIVSNHYPSHRFTLPFGVLGHTQTLLLLQVVWLDHPQETVSPRSVKQYPGTFASVSGTLHGEAFPGDAAQKLRCPEKSQLVHDPD